MESKFKVGDVVLVKETNLSIDGLFGEVTEILYPGDIFCVLMYNHELPYYLHPYLLIKAEKEEFILYGK